MKDKVEKKQFPKQFFRGLKQCVSTVQLNFLFTQILSTNFTSQHPISIFLNYDFIFKNISILFPSIDNTLLDLISQEISKLVFILIHSLNLSNSTEARICQALARLKVLGKSGTQSLPYRASHHVRNTEEKHRLRSTPFISVP